MEKSRDYLSSRVIDRQEQPWQLYGRRIVGQPRLWPILRYELLIGSLGGVPGGFGVWLRSAFYPLVFGRMEKKSFISAHVVIRHPHNIRLGERTFVDSFVQLDGISDAPEGGVEIAAGTYIHMFCVISAGYRGFVRIGRKCSINQGVQIFGTGGVTLGDNVLVGGLTSIIGYSHTFDDPATLVREQPITGQGIRIGNNVWIGANVVIRDGVVIGDGAVIGAGSVVTHEVASDTVVAGVPARLLRKRTAL